MVSVAAVLRADKSGIARLMAGNTCAMKHDANVHGSAAAIEQAFVPAVRPVRSSLTCWNSADRILPASPGAGKHRCRRTLSAGW